MGFSSGGPATGGLLALVPYHYLLRTNGRQEVADRDGEPLFDQRIENPVCLSSLCNETGTLQDTQMPRDRRSGNRESGGDFSGREFTSPQVREDLTPGWISECPEDAGLIVCHHRYLATQLDMTQELVPSSWTYCHR